MKLTGLFVIIALEVPVIFFDDTTDTLQTKAVTFRVCLTGKICAIRRFGGLSFTAVDQNDLDGFGGLSGGDTEVDFLFAAGDRGFHSIVQQIAEE